MKEILDDHSNFTRTEHLQMPSIGAFRRKRLLRFSDKSYTRYHGEHMKELEVPG